MECVYDTIFQKTQHVFHCMLDTTTTVFVIPSQTTLLTQRYLIKINSLSGIITAVESELANLRVHSLGNQSVKVWVLCTEMLSDLLKLNKSVSYRIDMSIGNDRSSTLSDYQKQLRKLRVMCDDTLASHDQLHDALVSNAKQDTTQDTAQDTEQVNSCLSHTVYPIVLRMLLDEEVSLDNAVILLNRTVKIEKSMSPEDRLHVNGYYAIKTHA